MRITSSIILQLLNTTLSKATNAPPLVPENPASVDIALDVATMVIAATGSRYTRSKTGISKKGILKINIQTEEATCSSVAADVTSFWDHNKDSMDLVTNEGMGISRNGKLEYLEKLTKFEIPASRIVEEIGKFNISHPESYRIDICNKIAGMSDAEMRDFCNYCEYNIENGYVAHVVLRLVYTTVVKEGSTYESWVYEDHCGILGVKRWAEEIELNRAKSALLNVFLWMDSEKQFDKYATITIKDNTVTLKVNTYSIKEIQDVFDYIFRKYGDGFPIHKLCISNTNFKGEEYPLSNILGHRIMRHHVIGLCFEGCIFDRNSLVTSSLEAAAISKISHLKVKSCDLERIFIGIKPLHKLRTLVIDGHKLERVPLSICYIKSLESLEIKNGELYDKIPDQLSYLTNLRKLYISYSSYYDHIPYGITSLSGLNKLVFYKCFLGEIPESMNNLEHLDTFIIDGCTVTSVDPSLDLPSVETFSAKDCEYTKLHELVYKMPNLINLRCHKSDELESHRVIRSISTKVKKLEHLSSLEDDEVSLAPPKRPSGGYN